jgi:two-component system, response regulator YesN
MKQKKYCGKNAKVRIKGLEFSIPGRILLVDDHAAFRSEFRTYFEEYDIIEAGSGEEALGILGKPNQIDLVILDVNMPGMNGIQVLEKIRKINSDIGIIIQTGYGSKEVILKAFRGHADDYIEKPLNIDATREVIEKILERRRGIPDMDISSSKDKIERVKRFVQRNCFKKISLKDATGVVYLSPKYLSRIFKQETGMAFQDYVLLIKMEKAKDFLEESSLNVDQIAWKLGYANSESFTRQFKKRTRFTPSGYRRKTTGRR